MYFRIHVVPIHHPVIALYTPLVAKLSHRPRGVTQAFLTKPNSNISILSELPWHKQQHLNFGLHDCSIQMARLSTKTNLIARDVTAQLESNPTSADYQLAESLGRFESLSRAVRRFTQLCRVGLSSRATA